MSYIDKLLEFDPAATALTVTKDSFNVIDLGAGSDSGPENLWVAVFIQTTFAAAGAATCTIAFQGASAVGGSFVTYMQSPALAVADMVAGAVFNMEAPLKQMAVAKNVFPRALKLVYTVATGPFTAGTLRADLLSAPQGMGITHIYPSGISVTN